jgi:hypothetical protein
MHQWQRIAPAFGLLISATPTVAQDRLEIPLSSLFATAANHTTMSFGSVGMDSHAGDSRRHEYFNIPDERAFKKVPGVWFRIPLGN